MQKRQVVVEEVTFENIQDAFNIKQRSETQIAAIEDCQMIALIGTVLGVVALLMSSVVSNTVATIAVILSCGCYAKAKCFSRAFKWGFNWAKWGWILIPYFPFDLVAAAVALCGGIMAFFFFPALGLRGVKKQAELDLHSANEYIDRNQM